MAVQRLTEEEVRGLPVTVDVPTAGRAWGYSRRKSYELAASGQFPCAVDRRGTGSGRLSIARSDLMRALGIEAAAPVNTRAAA